MVALLLRPL